MSMTSILVYLLIMIIISVIVVNVLGHMSWDVGMTFPIMGGILWISLMIISLKWMMLK